MWLREPEFMPEDDSEGGVVLRVQVNASHI